MINIDMGILLIIQQYLTSPFMDKMMVFVTHLGDTGFIWLVIAAIMLTSKKYREAGFLIVLALLVQSILGEGILKNIFSRERPFMGVEEFKLLINQPSSYSFPSGHTSSSFAVATIIYIYAKRFRVPIIVLASLIAFSRLYLFVHYPSDILGGIFLGIFSALAVSYCYEGYFKKKFKKNVVE